MVTKSKHLLHIMSNQIKVCVIGAGAAGLSAARHLVHRPNGGKSIAATVYEQSNDVGGTWVYDSNVGDNIHSSMYESLKTNLPKEVMAFPDFPFPKTQHSFLHHTEVKDYLSNYAKHFDLQKYIRLRTAVASVKRKPDGAKWDVLVEDLDNGKQTWLEYDSVVVCAGHYAKPNYPEIPGIEQFLGKTMHSHSYRQPTIFQGKTVIVLGAAASGSDISLEIAKVAKTVYLSHNNPKNMSKLPQNLDQVSGVKSCIGSNSFKLMDDTEISDVDFVLFCTGYKFTFPFLDDSCETRVSTYFVEPLFKHMINVNHPTLCFIGIPTQICPFPQFHLQSALFAKFLAGEIELPDRREMQLSLEEDWAKHKRTGRPQRHFHKMGPLQWEYNRDLAAIAHEPEISVCVENLYNDVHLRRREFLNEYKNEAYYLHGDSYIRQTIQ